MLHETKLMPLPRGTWCHSNGRSRSLRLTFALVFAAILQLPASCVAGAVGTIVPAYFYPGTGGPGGVGDGWAAMAAAAAEIPVTAILNPNSGPLPGSPDPNYVNAMTNLEQAGGHVVAYIYTGDGAVPLATVEGEVSTYITQYGGLIGGFFVDAMSLAPSTLSYYQDLDGYIKSLNSSYTVIGNTGNPRLHGVSPADYLSTADVFDIFEGPPDPGSSGFADYPYGEDWFLNYPSNRFSNTIYGVPVSALLPDLNKALQLNAGGIYITDVSGANPYDQLPSYWDQEVSELQRDPVEPVPEPNALSTLMFGGLVAFRVVAAKRGSQANKDLSTGP
jgi:Spherulation-specific family 4